MSQHFDRELDRLKRHLYELAELVEEAVRLAVTAIDEGDAALAMRVIDGDEAIDTKEVDLEEECLKTLALYQPVAIDLRFIVAVLKINNDLERIGDLAVNIAERALFLSTQPNFQMPLDFRTMVAKGQAMLRGALDALVQRDAKLAREICAADDQVDEINREMYAIVETAIRANVDDVHSLIHTLSASRHIERIADSATNIAEDVIYMVEGVVVRHKAESFAPPPP